MKPSMTRRPQPRARRNLLVGKSPQKATMKTSPTLIIITASTPSSDRWPGSVENPIPRVMAGGTNHARQWSGGSVSSNVTQVPEPLSDEKLSKRDPLACKAKRYESAKGETKSSVGSGRPRVV
jgi:hypothetical protein